VSTDIDHTQGQDNGCSGCGGRCGHDTPEECRGPKPLPWLPFDRCMFFYEARVFDAGEPTVLDIGRWPLGALSKGAPDDEDEVD
jgi:hypothetical protein